MINRNYKRQIIHDIVGYLVIHTVTRSLGFRKEIHNEYELIDDPLPT